MKAEPRQFDINKELPNVLLIGNGILMSTADINRLESKDWAEKILKLNNNNKEYENTLKNVPYSIQATIVADYDDNKRHNKYIEVFETLKFSDKSLLNDLVSLPFDAILTTNYTYEIENCFLAEYSELKDKARYARTVKRESLKDTKYLLHTYNQIGENSPIWHIHGENRRKTSIVLTHDEYSRLIYQLVKENKHNENKYVDYENEVKYKSWLDYFLMSNLYIVGLGMDFSEFDLWWILNRRKREKAAVGKVMFFESVSMKEPIKNALEALGVTVRQFPEVEGDDYITLYKKTTEYIKSEFEKQKCNNG